MSSESVSALDGNGKFEIALNEVEAKVFQILLDAARQSACPGLTVRAAGGWVRDKLLGQGSHDVDIVVDSVSGEDFAQIVSEYMKAKALPGCSKIGVVKQNVDQSKHLCTACFTVCGISMDVVKLRSEECEPESQLPAEARGTASEDAYRRDFTINSMFYNLNTASVEDFVGRGLADLKARRICTPLPARETFEDDPLRMLRAVRFAARFGCSLDGQILEAAREPRFAELLLGKVTRERVGLEVDRMMLLGAARPVRALELLASMGLTEAVFLPADVLQSHLEAKREAVAKASDLADGIALAGKVADMIGAGASEKDVRLGVLAAALSPWRGLLFMEKKRQRPLIYGVLRYALKLGNDVSEQVATLAATAESLAPLPQGDGSSERLRVGRQLMAVKEKWAVALALAALLHSSDYEAAVVAFREAKAWVEASKLTGCWDWKPLVDGKRLMEPPFSVPKGKRLGSLIEAQLNWRMEDPSMDVEKCEQLLLKESA